ncbi:hypothetical protein CU011_1966 [Enterococcus faecium]|nr:hypothetical protein [Enterococcus faecium]MBK4862127.1 hypothetical protein [Enterococcus faecium]MBK4872684.1 hypothetical protein [Enterococcus faecium]MBK4883462.1 hypothetical protein [Enterococcus faecium]
MIQENTIGLQETLGTIPIYFLIYNIVIHTGKHRKENLSP